MAADGHGGTSTATGLGGLHAAMAAGRLDSYRAGAVAYELEEVPAEVARTVIATVDGFLDREDAARLKRRVRRVLAAISPDLLRRRAVRARSESSLRRWVDEPGVDTWLGTFPSEEACAAWGAIDALAQRYVADGTCERIDRARAKALTDLVTASATIDLRVTLVVPVGAEPTEPTGAGDLVEVAVPAASTPSWSTEDGSPAPAPSRRHARPAATASGGFASSRATRARVPSSTRRATSRPTRTGREGAWPTWCVDATAGAGFPAATSRRASATSTTCSRGRPAPRPPRTSCACAGGTTASSSDPAGGQSCVPTARWSGPTPPDALAPPPPVTTEG